MNSAGPITALIASFLLHHDVPPNIFTKLSSPMNLRPNVPKRASPKKTGKVQLT